MTNVDIRWKQRFTNYKKAHTRLKYAAAFFEEKSAGGTEAHIAEAHIAMEALIKCFEFTFELAWQTMKDFISYKGFVRDIYGSRDSIRSAQQFDLIENGQIWIDMIDDRNHAAHAYDEINAKYLSNRIIEYYCGEFIKFEVKMDTLL